MSSFSKGDTDVYTLDDNQEKWDALHCQHESPSRERLSPLSASRERLSPQAETDESGVVGQQFRRQGQEWDSANREWVDCSEVVREHDRTIMQNWNNEMDTSLLFASLFSGIVAGFILEASHLIRDRNGRYDSLHNKLSSIATNVLWFASLILSLNAVLCAILVKQWLSEYAWEHEGPSVLSPRVNFAVRHLRFQRLHSSNIPTFIDYLPLQMIVGVGLFYAGLLSFMWGLDPIVAGICTGLTAASISIFVVTTYLPAKDPLSPYQSIQGWIARRATEFVSSKLRSSRSGRQRRMKADGPKPESWVDYSLLAVQSNSEAQYESTGLQWLQSSLVAWKPEVVKQSFGCALSLSEGIRAQTVVSLCMEFFPKTVLDTEDPKAMANFALQYGDAVEESMFVTVYTTLATHLSMLVDPKETFVSPTRGELIFNISRILLVMLLHPEWFEARKADGWSLLFALANSAAVNQISYDPRKALVKRMYSTFLDQALATTDVREDDEDYVDTRLITDAQIQAILFPAKWSPLPLPSRLKHAEEDHWIITNGCLLFAILNFRTSTNNDTKGSVDELGQCFQLMTSYLHLKSLSVSAADPHAGRAVTLWTRILCYRPDSAMRLSFSHRRTDVENASLRELLDALLNFARTPISNLEEISDRLWGLRLLTGSVPVIHELLRDVPTSVDFSGSPTAPIKTSALLSSRLRYLTAQELVLVGEKLLRAFPLPPWRASDLEFNYRHVLMSCFLFHAVFSNTQNIRFEGKLFDHPANLLKHDDRTIALLPDREQKTVEAALISTLHRFAERRRARKYAIETEDADEGQVGPDLRSTRTLLVEAVVKQGSIERSRGPLFLALSSATLVLLVPWTQCQISEYPAMQSVLACMTTFLSRGDLDKAALGRRHPKSWITLCLQDIRTSLKLNPQAWGKKTTGQLGKFLQVLHDVFDFSSWTDEERKAFVDVLKESKCELDDLDRA